MGLYAKRTDRLRWVVESRRSHRGGTVRLRKGSAKLELSGIPQSDAQDGKSESRSGSQRQREFHHRRTLPYRRSQRPFEGKHFSLSLLVLRPDRGRLIEGFTLPR